MIRQIVILTFVAVMISTMMGCSVRPGAESVLTLQFPDVDPVLSEEIGFRDAVYRNDSIEAAGSRLFEHKEYDYVGDDVKDIWKPRRIRIEPGQAPGFYLIELDIDHSYTPYPGARSDIETEHEGKRYRMERYHGVARLKIRESLWDRRNVTLPQVELKRMQVETQKVVLSGTIVAEEK